MIKNYLKIALRTIAKNKIFSVINISGLAIGLACCLLISIYIKDELSFDQYHENADRTYRLTREFMSPDGSTSLHLSRLAPPFMPLLKEDFPEMEVMTHFVYFDGTIKYEDKIFNEEDIGWADNDIFNVFDFEFLKGNPDEALAEPGTMVISEEIALKYFDTIDAVGKVISFDNQANLKITGVFKAMPENSHFQLKMIGDFFLVEQFYGGRERMMQAWGSNNFSTYFILKEGASISEIERRIPEFLIKHLSENANDWTALHIQKLADIHLHSNLDDELGSNSDIKYVYIFASIALLILLIAMINYMNLATAKSSNRAKEVGMRKVMGAVRGNLVSQFMTESILIAFISIILAFVLVQFSLPQLRLFTERQLIFSDADAFIAFGLVTIFGIFIGILSGSYPALFLSSFEPISVLKGKLSSGFKSAAFRRVLVVVQFSISAILIVSTGVIFQQLSYIQDKELGYEKDHILVLPRNDEIAQKFDVFKNTILGHELVKEVGSSSRVPTIQLLDSQGARAEIDNEMVAPEVVIKYLATDHEFMKVYDMEIVAGRYFDRSIQSDDTAAFILNESAVAMIGWGDAESAVGKKMTYGGKEGRVIGVAQDIHFETLQNEISPLIMYVPEGVGRLISVKLSGKNIKETLEFIDESWTALSPSYPIEYDFIDERFEALYKSEDQRASLFTGFSLLAIFLACLGLFGLASFTVLQRAKEMSIRKVLGASIAEIVRLLSNEFLTLVAISIIVAFPISYIMMSGWLENYAYRIEMNVLPYLVAAVLCITIAFLTISMQTLKAATRNPVDTLKED